MQLTKIEWLHWPDGRPGYSWNPIQGLCPQGCWYCYARKIYTRFKKDPEIRLELSGGTPDLYSPPSRIFLCSTFELFHPAADAFRDEIFMHIVGSPHTFFILTKRPELIDREMPENVWLGISLTGFSPLGANIKRVENLVTAKANKKFISFEPLLEVPEFFDSKTLRPDWVIIGKLTGHGKVFSPTIEQIKTIIWWFQAMNTPIFLKNNLSGIWPGKLIQEFPTVTP